MMATRLTVRNTKEYSLQGESERVDTLEEFPSGQDLSTTACNYKAANPA